MEEPYINYDLLNLIYQNILEEKSSVGYEVSTIKIKDFRENRFDELLKFRQICGGFKNYLDLYDVNKYKIEIENRDEATNLLKISNRVEFKIRSRLFDDFNNDSIKGFPNLTSLRFSENAGITDETLMGLTKLKSLIIPHNKEISNEGICGLTSLTKLNVWKCEKIDDEGIRDLTNLTYVHFNDDAPFTDQGIKGLVNLTSLDCTIHLTNDGIKGLTNIANLGLRHNNQITDEWIK